MEHPFLINVFKEMTYNAFFIDFDCWQDSDRSVMIRFSRRLYFPDGQNTSNLPGLWERDDISA